METIGNPLGVVPVVELRNADRLLDAGTSEMADVMPLTDALNKSLADMMVASEYFARPRRYATGIELDEDSEGNSVNPFGESDRMMIAEPAEARFGQLEAANLAAYENAVKVLLGQIMAVSALPPHYLQVSDANPTSADALRASEASLAARAEARQRTFGRSWEQAARLMTAAADGVDPASVDVAVTWADPGTRSIGQEVDAVVKLVQAGLLPPDAALERLGYTAAQIDRIRGQRRAAALDGAGVDLREVLPT